jgi:hypothetical protein
MRITLDISNANSIKATPLIEYLKSLDFVLNISVILVKYLVNKASSISIGVLWLKSPVEAIGVRFGNTVQITKRSLLFSKQKKRQ